MVFLACAGCYAPSLRTGSPCSPEAPCPAELVCSAATQTCEHDDTPADAAPDAFVAVVGAGTVASPYTAVSGAPASCAAFLAAFPAQAGLDGIYRIKPTAPPLDAYCDMTTDGGGWMLVARVLGTSTTHTKAAAIGMVTAPAQTTTAKLSDATINTIAFTTTRFVIATAGTFYAKVSKLDLAGAQDFMTPNVASPVLGGPYTFTFLTQTTCTSDCGISIVRPDLAFGSNCGYQYFADANSPKPGMGCQGNASNDGTVWIK